MNSPSPDWTAVRAQLPILCQVPDNGHPLFYLDSASRPRQPQVVCDALKRYDEPGNANVHRGHFEPSAQATARASLYFYDTAEEIDRPGDIFTDTRR